jgi:DNA gyrase/topoisomerase IV subunit A
MTVLDLVVTRCHYCNQVGSKTTLKHDGNGFITCRDDTSCVARANKILRVQIAELEEELAALNANRERLIRLIARKKKEAGIVDDALVEYNKWLAEMRAEDDQC